MKEQSSEFIKPSYTSTTNWIVSNGSLNDSISFETPISSITDEHDDNNDNDNDNEEEEFHDSPKVIQQHQPLVLIPNSSSDLDDESEDYNPCEIKLSFEQRHEIRQVYVRSTARTYEIYYASGPESSNEYLCTVRCGLATKEEHPNEESTSAHPKRSDDRKEHPEHIKTGSSSSADEDGWVEVKAPDSALSDSKVKGDSIIQNTEKRNQDTYEATAEITDSSPCISITLRLLSLHTKGCIQLEEIYIFGEPVDPTESDGHADPLKSSEQSSMMAMLVPTLLQFSKTGMMKRTEDKHVSNIRPELKPQEDESVGQTTGSTSHIEARPNVPNQQPSVPNQPVNVEPIIGQGPRNVSSSSRTEHVLDQLLSRIGRIEAFCSNFEENMLKPISNIESRLERIEQQMELLTTRTHVSEFYPCTRISAPDFSCIESETNSLQNDEPRSPPNASESVVGSQSFPTLIVTAPEFSNQDDNDDAIGSKKDSPVYKPKPSLSLDDSIAMALAGFTSSSSQLPKINRPWTVEAPDFPDEDNGGNDDSSRCMTTDAIDGSCCDKTINGDSDEEVEVDNYNNAYGFATLKSFQATDVSTEAVDGSCDDRSLNQTIGGEDSDEECPVVSSTNASTIAVIRGFPILEEGDDDISVNQSIAENSDDLNGEDGNIYQSMKGEDVQKWLVANPGNNRDEVESVLDQNFTPIVDFELPVLDVKFERHGDMHSGYSLETLLSVASEDTGKDTVSKDDNSSVAVSEGLVWNRWMLNENDYGTPYAMSIEEYISSNDKVEDGCFKFGSENRMGEFVGDDDSLVESDNVVEDYFRGDDRGLRNKDRESCASYNDGNRFEDNLLEVVDELLGEIEDVQNVANFSIPEYIPDASETDGRESDSCAKCNDHLDELFLRDDSLMGIENVKEKHVNLSNLVSVNEGVSVGKDENSMVADIPLSLEKEFVENDAELENSRMEEHIISENGVVHDKEEGCEDNGKCAVTGENQGLSENGVNDSEDAKI